MPSIMLMNQSGGTSLVSGNPFSGGMEPIGGVQLKLAAGAAGNIYVGYIRANPASEAVFSGFLSGFVTVTSGGSLSSGGLGDGMEMAPGDSYYIPRGPISGRLDAIRIAVPAASSGARLYWELL